MRLKPFDTSDVEAEALIVTALERRLTRANELRVRAFAQGYIAAAEDVGSPDLYLNWVHYKERACSRD